MYFKECDDYVDGGVKANNPCSYGLTRIQRYNRQKKEGTKISCLVSVGCGIFPPEPIGNTDIAAAIRVTQLHKAPGRMMELLKLLTNAVSLYIAYHLMYINIVIYTIVQQIHRLDFYTHLSCIN